MLVSRSNRYYLRRVAKSRALRIIGVLFVVISFFDAVRIRRNIVYDYHHSIASKSAVQASGERIYIASMHFNDAKIINRWSRELMDLVDVLGPDNVFVSIYESGSWDETKEHLLALDSVLGKKGVAKRVVTSDVTHRDEINNPDKGEGWITTSRNKKELRRIPYLSRLRNKTIKDLVDLYAKGITFDKVLFLNDVIFSVDDVLTLINTNNGEYGAACSMDFSKPPYFYDTFALRDIEGNPHIMQTWPYFKARGSRTPLINNHDAVPVTSCWNGIVVMPAEPFVSATRLQFRGVPDSLAMHHLEGSECCLIHADNPLSKTQGVYLNPRVRVGYNVDAYDTVHAGTSWVSTWEIFKGLWINRIMRWTVFTFDSWTVNSRIRTWRKEKKGNQEPGVFCLINEMQVLVENGWAHV